MKPIFLYKAMRTTGIGLTETGELVGGLVLTPFEQEAVYKKYPLHICPLQEWQDAAPNTLLENLYFPKEGLTENKLYFIRAIDISIDRETGHADDWNLEILEYKQ